MPIHYLMPAATSSSSNTGGGGSQIVLTDTSDDATSQIFESPTPKKRKSTSREKSNNHNNIPTTSLRRRGKQPSSKDHEQREQSEENSSHLSSISLTERNNHIFFAPPSDKSTTTISRSERILKKFPRLPKPPPPATPHVVQREAPWNRIALTDISEEDPLFRSLQSTSRSRNFSSVRVVESTQNELREPGKLPESNGDLLEQQHDKSLQDISLHESSRHSTKDPVENTCQSPTTTNSDPSSKLSSPLSASSEEKEQNKSRAASYPPAENKSRVEDSEEPDLSKMTLAELKRLRISLQTETERLDETKQVRLFVFCLLIFHQKFLSAD